MVRVTPTGNSVTVEAGGEDYTVSRRKSAGGLRPVLDIASDKALSPLVGYNEFRMTSRSPGVMTLTPSIRAFYIRKQQLRSGPIRVVELFCGGGTMSQALIGNPNFEIVGGLEVEPKFADIWAEANPNATLIQGDIRAVSPLDIPDCDAIFAGIPCNNHSTMGRAKNGLVGAAAEGGNYGGLYTDVLSMVRHKRPSVCVFENVPNYQNSPAGLALATDLQQMGYHWTDYVLEPTTQWGEPSTRRRWLGIATTLTGFTLNIPNRPFTGTMGTFLDAPSEADKTDCERIANTIVGLRAHNARHQAKGNGFGFTTINHESTSCPTIVRSYHKINVGPFVETPHGLRMLRASEIERIHGCELRTPHYATAVEVAGQGVQTRVFREVFRQLGEFLQ
jgi:DNA (cytosine-5)-methyltransferase 1